MIPEDLRKGNYVENTIIEVKEEDFEEFYERSFSLHRAICKISEICFNKEGIEGWCLIFEDKSIASLELEEEQDDRLIQPIKMDKIWLDKFGFIWVKSKPGTQGIFSNGKLNVHLSNSGNVYNMRNKLIPYVHTFQNWYYFTLLTGEEIKVIRKSKNTFTKKRI